MSRSGHLAFGWALALLAMAAFASLGVWQLRRMHAKQAMLGAAQRVLVERHALPLQAAADPRRARDYDWSAGSGRFVDVAAVLLDNQQRDGRAGVRVYRLFQPAAGGTPLLVELGWLPLPGDRAMPEIARSNAATRISGLLAPPPSAGIARATAAPQAGGAVLTIALDLPMLERALVVPRIAPRLLRLDPALPLGYARDLQMLPNTLPPQQHLGYAVQWFALALAVLATALVLTFRKPNTRIPQR